MIVKSGEQFVSEVSAVTFSSDAIPLQQKGFCIQAKWVESVASLAGTVKIQASVNGETFSDIGNTTKTISGSGSEIWNMSEQFYPYLKLVFTLTGGTGVFGAWITSKNAG